MVNIKKAVIIGCGFVGSSIAFALRQKGQFNELVLIDANKAKAEGEARDLAHGLPYAYSRNIYAGNYEDTKDASVIIITAGASQKPGETRLDLIHKNARIRKSVIAELNRVQVEGILLIVANPVDVLTHIAYKASGLPSNRVFGSGTVLDTARLKYLLSKRLSVDTKNVHAVIIGEHGDSETPIWSGANISGIPLNDFCARRGYTDHDAGRKQIQDDVVNSAYKIIEKKGATYYGIALSVSHIVSCIVNDTHTRLPVSVELNGTYGLSDLALSIPSLVGRSGVEKVLELPLTNKEKERLEKSAAALKEVIAKAR